MIDAFLERLFGMKREPLGVKLRRVVAADHVNGCWPSPEPEPAFEGWRYLLAARNRAAGYAA